MKIAAAQTKPIKGDIEKNIANHISLVNLAIEQKADAIFFPELSIIGYEPEIAKDLATDENDKRFGVFQQVADENEIAIAIGLPINKNGVQISMAIFQPHVHAQTYAKQFLHSSETSWFANGEGQIFLNIKNEVVAPAICYELNEPAHAAHVFEKGAGVYMACTVNSKNGIDKDVNRLAVIAKTYKVPVLMSNCIGITGGYNCAGKTSAWDTNGNLLMQLDGELEGILVLDTETMETKKAYQIHAHA
jgi:predicted amidohydrolase